MRNRQKIFVIGDVMLDLYIRGDVSRISPEAPVLVVSETSRQMVLGGAGNVANNIISLGGQATLVGVIGQDAEGQLINKLCRAAKIKTNLAIDAGRPTTTKTRALAHRHHLLRVDREKTDPLSPKIEASIISSVKKAADHDLVIISDYAKGLITKNIIIALENRFGKDKILANFKPANAHLFKNILALTHNLKEAEKITSIYADSDLLAEKTALALGRRFLSSVILTRGEKGMTIWKKGSKECRHIPAITTKLVDVTGAGDTVIAVLALMLAGGSDLLNSARLANHAAGLVVGMEGTAVVSLDYLKKALSNESR